jgi:hypothetical protein
MLHFDLLRRSTGVVCDAVRKWIRQSTEARTLMRLRGGERGNEDPERAFELAPVLLRNKWNHLEVPNDNENEKDR